MEVVEVVGMVGMVEVVGMVGMVGMVEVTTGVRVAPLMMRVEEEGNRTLPMMEPVVGMGMGMRMGMRMV